MQRLRTLLGATGPRALLSDGRLAQSVLPARDRPAQGWDVDADGFAAVDLLIEDGRIAALRPHQAGMEGLGLGGALLWPGFVDAHTHLDKGHIWARRRNPDGTHAGAAAAVAADRRAHWTADDIARRFAFGLRCAHARGTVAIRTHLDSYEPDQARTAWEVFETMRRDWAGRIALQGVMMARLEQYLGEDGEALAALAARTGGCLGGILRITPHAGETEVDAVDRGLDRLFTLATRFGLDIDLHVDETGDPAASGLRAVARAALRHRFGGRIACGHCCALSVQDEAMMTETIALAAEARITVICLPLANQFLQDRVVGRTPRWRGIAPVHELRAAGVEVVVASDNCRDPFYAFGDHDLADVLRDFARIAHADLELGAWADSVTRLPAALLGHPPLAIGAPADLVVMAARSASEFLARPGAERVVLRAGQVLDAALPDYETLDDLSGQTAGA